MKKSELREVIQDKNLEIGDLKEKLKAAYQEITDLKVLIKAGDIMDEEEEGKDGFRRCHEDWLRLKEKETCAIDLEKVAAAL